MWFVHFREWTESCFFLIACRDFRFLYCGNNDKNLDHKRNIGFGILFLVWGIFLSSLFISTGHNENCLKEKGCYR